MGKIEVESEENRFTRFRITLPQDEQNDLSISVTSPDKTAELQEVKAEDPIEPAGTEKTDKDGKKAGTVLIVEDNEEFISYLTRVIGQRYHIHTAGNGEEALKSLENLKPGHCHQRRHDAGNGWNRIMQTNKKRHQSKSYPGNPAHSTHGYSK